MRFGLLFSTAASLGVTMTHLNVPVGQIVNLESMQLSNDNRSKQLFFDRQSAAPFNVPDGHCFVVTDIFVQPAVTSFVDDQFYLVVVTADAGRSISVRSDGKGAHLPLAGGIVVPGPGVPAPGSKGLSVRNTTFSSGPVGVQLLGYLTEGDGPEVGKPFAP